LEIEVRDGIEASQEALNDFLRDNGVNDAKSFNKLMLKINK